MAIISTELTALLENHPSYILSYWPSYNLKLVESMITANDTNDLERFTKEHKEKFSELNVMEQSPKIKFQKDGAALHFLPKSLINLEKQMNIFLAR